MPFSGERLLFPDWCVCEPAATQKKEPQVGGEYRNSSETQSKVPKKGYFRNVMWLRLLAPYRLCRIVTVSDMQHAKLLNRRLCTFSLGLLTQSHSRAQQCMYSLYAV